MKCKCGDPGYLNQNGLIGKQPDPDPAWDDVDSVNSSDSNIFYFAYDWRLSPFRNAEILNDYIKAVKTYTTAEKVYIQPASAANGVVLAYVDAYVLPAANPDVGGILFSNSMANGMGAYGSVLSKKLLLDARNLGYADGIPPIIEKLDPQLRMILHTLYLAGLLDAVFSLLEFIPAKFMDTLFDESFIPCYGLFPGMWALVPPDMYEGAKQASFGGKLNDPAYADYFSLLDRYCALQKNSSNILQAAEKKIKVGVVSGYGLSAFAVNQNQGMQGDGTVETVYASFGATCSPARESLGLLYKQKNSACGHTDHVSPDNMVDASACALPDRTWFIREMVHGNHYDVNGFFAWWYSTEDPTVYSSARWPQFLYAYGERGEGRQEAVYPFVPPIFSGSKQAALLAEFWNRVLTIWNRMLYVLTGGAAKALRNIANPLG